MKADKVWIAKDGWPVEQIKGRWFVNWLRVLIHGKRKVSRSEYERDIHNLR